MEQRNYLIFRGASQIFLHFILAEVIVLCYRE